MNNKFWRRVAYTLIAVGMLTLSLFVGSRSAFATTITGNGGASFPVSSVNPILDCGVNDVGVNSTNFGIYPSLTVSGTAIFKRDVQCTTGATSGLQAVQTGFEEDGPTSGGKCVGFGGNHGVFVGMKLSGTWNFTCLALATNMHGYDAWSFDINVKNVSGTYFVFYTVCDVDQSTNNCVMANSNTGLSGLSNDFSHVKQQEEIWNWTSGVDSASTIEWELPYYDDGSLNYLTCGITCNNGSNPPWFGNANGQNNLWYSCSLFGNPGNPC